MTNPDECTTTHYADERVFRTDDIELTLHHGGLMVVTATDEGIGIPPEATAALRDWLAEVAR